MRSYAMLVITRREGEEVVIGDPAAPLGIVRIASIKGDRVRIAFEFPREILVHRREIANQINSAEPGKDGNPIVGQIRPASGGETP
ncbi:MAG: carbon storage regulator [Planctomycetota bacterium]|nr:MAG: carbon storage regulator [Planctomycetota bacterium]RLT00801.1 MAG: carbon storage regulator [Planctomycetota bacterium]